MDRRAWQRLSVRKEAKVCKKSICRLFLSCAQAMHKEKRRKLLGPSPNRMSIASAYSPSLTDKSIFCTERGPLEQKTSELIDLKSLFYKSLRILFISRRQRVQNAPEAPLERGRTHDIVQHGGKVCSFLRPKPKGALPNDQIRRIQHEHQP